MSMPEGRPLKSHHSYRCLCPKAAIIVIPLVENVDDSVKDKAPPQYSRGQMPSAPYPPSLISFSKRHGNPPRKESFLP